MRTSCVALDITNSDIRVASIENGKITKWQSEPLPDGLVRGGTINEPRAVSVIIDNLFKTQNLSKSRVVCCITGLPFIYRTIVMPGIGRDISAEAIERAARKEMSLSDEDMLLAWQSVEEREDKKETDYFIVGVPKISISPLLDTLSLAKIHPISVDLKPLALARAVSTETALVVSLEKNYFDITLVANGRVRVIHSLSPSSGDTDTAGIVNELVDGLNKAVKSFYREFPRSSLPPETPIFLSGELASDQEMLTLVRDATGHPTSILKCQIETPPEMPIKLFGANIGLILKRQPAGEVQSQYKDININLLARIHKKNKPKFKAIYAVTALIVVILAAGVYYVYDMKSKAEIKSVSLQQQSLDITKKMSVAQKTNKDLLASKQATAAQLQSVSDQVTALTNARTQIDGQKRNYAFRMTYVLNKLPTGAEYKALNMTRNSVQATSLAKTPIDAVKFSEDVAQNDIFVNARVVRITPVTGTTKVEFTVQITE
jgi:Tfp pilus assembly protein PilN